MKVKPFKGVRPPKEWVKEVASRPYDVLNSEEARKEAEGKENHSITLSNRKSIFLKEKTNMMPMFMKSCREFSFVPTKRMACAR
jgi:uncharacterized protein (DUF1015 family)